jgi:hypothetical protein
MRCRALFLLLPACFAGAAELGMIAVSSSQDVTRVSIAVTGTFHFSKNQLADRIYIDLAGVKPASSGTQKTEVRGGPVIAVRAAGHAGGTRVVFDLQAPADFTVAQSSSGLTVELRAAAVGAASRPAPQKPPGKRAARKPAPAVTAVPPAQLKNVPELASDTRVIASRPEPPSPAPPSPPPYSPPSAPQTRSVPTAPAVPASPPLLRPTRLQQRPESDFFDEGITDPTFPAVDESTVEAPANVSVYVLDDKALALPEVLRKHNGFFAFGQARNPGYATAMIRVADFTRVAMPMGMVSLAEYSAFLIPGSHYRIVDELRARFDISPALDVYAVFPDTFDRVLSRQIRAAAARSGRPGRVIAARFAFSATDPTGIEVSQVRVRPVEVR